MSDDIDVKNLHGVKVLTTFGWKYIGAYRSRAAAEAVAKAARDLGIYLGVDIS